MEKSDGSPRRIFGNADIGRMLENQMAEYVGQFVESFSSLRCKLELQSLGEYKEYVPNGHRCRSQR